jgi:hypothetical protein
MYLKVHAKNCLNSFFSSLDRLGLKKTKKEGKMKKLLVELLGMGAFFGCQAGIFYDGKRIFCDSLNQNYECNMSDLGHGMTAVCPLWGFVIDVKEKIRLLKWWEYLNKDKSLKEVAKLLEEFLDIKCDICGKRIESAFNLLHYNSQKKSIVCDFCFNHEPEKSNELLF